MVGLGLSPIIGASSVCLPKCLRLTYAQQVGRASMVPSIGIALALTLIICGVPVSDARADGITVRPAKQRVVHRKPRCLHDQCGYPIACPDRTCGSLYGAYGPYGGFYYWS